LITETWNDGALWLLLLLLCLLISPSLGRWR